MKGRNKKACTHTPPRKGEGARTCTTADATVVARDATLQQYSTREEVRMRGNMTYTAPIGSKGVGIIHRWGWHVPCHAATVDISGAARLDEHTVLQRQQ